MGSRFLTVGQERNIDMGTTRMSLGCWVGIGGCCMNSEFSLYREKDGWIEREINVGGGMCITI